MPYLLCLSEGPVQDRLPVCRQYTTDRGFREEVPELPERDRTGTLSAGKTVRDGTAGRNRAGLSAVCGQHGKMQDAGPYGS